MTTPAPQATTAGSYTPILTDFLRLVRAPFAPRGVFEEQRDKPTFWLPWIVLSVFFVALALYNMPVAYQAMKVAIEARGQTAPATMPMLPKVIAIVGGPIGLLIGAAITAVVCYLILMVVGAQARFMGLMTLAIFVSPIAFYQQVVSSIVLRLRGIETIQSMRDMQVSFGLDLLVPTDTELPRALGAVLRGVGPFEIWSLVVTAIALMALEKVPKNKAWTTAVVAFVVGLVIRAGSALVFRLG